MPKGSTKGRNRGGLVNVRTGTGSEAIAAALLVHLRYVRAKLPQHATRGDWYMALAYSIRDRMLDSGRRRQVATRTAALRKNRARAPSSTAAAARPCRRNRNGT